MQSKTITRAVLVICAATVALNLTTKATLIAVGDPFESNSWGQGFINSSGPYYAFDEMLIFSRSGAGFEAPAFRNFSISGWSVTKSSGSEWAIAEGPTVPANSQMTFDIIFEGSSSSPLTFDFYAFDDGTLRESTRATWNGGWSFSAAPTPPPAVPDGGVTLLLLGAAIGALRLMSKRVS